MLHNIPQLDWWFVYNILHIAGSRFSCSLVFYVVVVSIALYAENSITSFPLYVQITGCLFLDNTLLPTLKLGGVQFVVFSACLNLFSSKVFLAMSSARQCDSRPRCPQLGSLRNHCIGSRNWRRSE